MMQYLDEGTKQEEGCGLQQGLLKGINAQTSGLVFGGQKTNPTQHLWF